jgi:hypothetical protein
MERATHLSRPQIAVYRCPIIMKTDSEIIELDKKMIAVGMIPLSQMLKSSPLGKYAVHKGVDNLALFEQWLDMRFKEMMKMKARMLLAKKEDDELFEWVLAHAAVLGEIRTQFNACKSNTPDP